MPRAGMKRETSSVSVDDSGEHDELPFSDARTARATARCVPLSEAGPSVSCVHAGIVGVPDNMHRLFRPRQYVHMETN